MAQKVLRSSHRAPEGSIMYSLGKLCPERPTKNEEE